MGEERRQNERFRVCGGNADIESVIGRGKKPNDRARILNWSRGGLLLKVKSPRRRFLVAKAEPVLWDGDSLTCTLRLPPVYKEIFVTGEVVHVQRASDDADWLEVGVQFDEVHTPAAKLEALAKILEPKARSASGRLAKARSSRLGKINETISDRLGPISDEAKIEKPKKKSKRVKRSSQRVAKGSSERLRSKSKRAKKQRSQRLEQA